MREFLKKNQAITLVSLVVTIIILIILAGVSINLILGKNGIITIAKQAKENTELAKIEEEVALNELYMQIETEGIGSGSNDAITKLVEFKREIASAISDMGVTTSESASVDTMASNIRSISGASSADKVSYDNTNSGLAANNVQSAVDEVNNSLMKEWTLIADVTTANTKVQIDFSSEGYTDILIVLYRSGLNLNALNSALYPVSLYDSLPNADANLSVFAYNDMGTLRRIDDSTAYLQYSNSSTTPQGVALYAR